MVGCKRATAALDERAQERLWGGGSATSGSDRSASCSPELADLVDSFYGGDDQSGMDDCRSSCASKVVRREREVLGRLVVGGVDGELGSVGKRVREEVEMVVVGSAGMEDDKGFKRMVVASLRDCGFDAGLCKSRPEGKTTRFPSGGRHEYIDVLVDDGTRYFVDLNIAAEFEIARPTPEYVALLAAFPAVFVGRAETLREIVGMMCEAAKESLQRHDMHVPPWRRTEYMLAKWFGPCKRTTNRVAKHVDVGGRSELEKKKVVVATAAAGGGGGGGGGKYCRVEYGRREEWEKRRLEVGLVMGNYM